MPRACAAAQISSTGGSHPVTLDAPVMASRAGRRPVVEHGDHVVDASKVPSVPHSTQRRVGHPGPGQQVGVVLDHGGGHHVVGSEAQAVGQVVDGLGRVAAQDATSSPSAGRPAKRCTLVAGRLVGRGGVPGLVAGPPVHARVPGQELGHAVGHHGQGRRRCGAVEVAVRAGRCRRGRAPGSAGADERRDGGLRCHPSPTERGRPRIRSRGPRYPASRGGALRVRAGPFRGRARRRRPGARAAERRHLRAVRDLRRALLDADLEGDPTRRMCEQHLALATPR